MKPIGDEYLGSCVQCKCHVIQGKPISTNYAQPHGGGNTHKIKNYWVLTASNQSSTDSW